MSTLNVNLIKQEGLKIREFTRIPPRKTSGPSKDIDDFLSLINSALETQFDRDSTPKDKRLKLKASWPKEQIENSDNSNDYVVGNVASRKRGNMSPDRERRPMGKLRRETAQHPTDNDIVIEVNGEWRDNIIEFNIMSADASRANYWALWFEKFIQAWTFYFRDMGINELYFDQRLADTIQVIGGTTVHVRPIRFFVRTELISQTFLRKIDEIHIRFDAGHAMTKQIINDQYGINDYSIYEPDFKTQKE